MIRARGKVTVQLVYYLVFFSYFCLAELVSCYTEKRNRIAHETCELVHPPKLQRLS